MFRFFPFFRFPGLIATVLLCLACACTAGCVLLSAQPKRGTLAAKMMNLSAAVENYFSELPGPPPLDMEEKEILKLATEHDNDLLAREFKRYRLKVQYQAGHAVLLLCSEDGTKVLMEDAGCTARLDRKAFRENLPCAFALTVNEDCVVEGGDPE